MERKIRQEFRLQRRNVALRTRHGRKAKRASYRSAHRNHVEPRTVLTDREYAVLLGIASARCDEEIAKKLNISLTDVETDIKSIYKKLNAPNRLQAILWATAYL